MEALPAPQGQKRCQISGTGVTDGLEPQWLLEMKPRSPERVAKNSQE